MKEEIDAARARMSEQMGIEPNVLRFAKDSVAHKAILEGRLEGYTADDIEEAPEPWVGLQIRLKKES